MRLERRDAGTSLICPVRHYSALECPIAMEEAFFNQNFWRSIVSTAVGAGFALVIAYGAYRASRGGETKAQRERRKALATALVATLEVNGQVLERFEGLDPGHHIHAWVDTATLEATAGLRYELLGDIELSARIDDLLGHLSTVNRLQDLLLPLSYGAGASLEGVRDLRAALSESTAAHAVAFRELADEATVSERLRAIAGNS